MASTLLKRSLRKGAYSLVNKMALPDDISLNDLKVLKAPGWIKSMVT
jgi:hypothetical protein